MAQHTDVDETTELSIVDEAPMADDLQEALSASSRRGPWRNKATRWLLTGVLIVGGFLGGVVIQQQFGSDSTGGGTATGGPGGGTGQYPGGGSGEFPGGGQAPGGGTGTGDGTATPAATGTIVLVDDETVYVETSDGTKVAVKTTDATVVSVLGLSGELAKGDKVSVTGETADDGTVMATAVTETD